MWRKLQEREATELHHQTRTRAQDSREPNVQKGHYAASFRPPLCNKDRNMGIFLPGQFKASKLECFPPHLAKSNNKHPKLENTSTQVCWSSASQPSATPHLSPDQPNHCTCDTNTAIELPHHNPQPAKTQTETFPNLPQEKHR